MNFKSFALALSFLFLSLFMAGQSKGFVEINVNGSGDYHYTGKTITYNLLKNDTVYRTIANFDMNYRWEIDSLPVGIYTLKITADSLAFATFYNIKVDTIRMHNYDFNLYNHSYVYRKQAVDDTLKTDVQKIEISLNTLYGNNTWHETIHKNYNELYSGEFAFNFYTPVAKYYSIGAKIGGQYANTGFYNDTSRYLGSPTLSKYYSSLIINGALINRFTFYNNKLLHKDGLKLDLGIAYNFPLFFKEIVRADDNTKIITRYIHRYNDFSAIVRIAYKYIGLQAEYNIFNFLKSRYTEIPTLRAGIVFLIPVPVD
jgi:hypothetical protein